MWGQGAGQGHFAFSRSWFILLPLLLMLLSCVTLSPTNAPAEKPLAVATPEAALPRWLPFAEDRTEGLSYWAGKTARPRLAFWALRVDLAAPCLRITVKPGAKGDGGEITSAKVSSFVRGNNLLAGINALPFDPVSGREGEKRTNIGIVVDSGALVSPPHSGFDALVLFMDGGAAIVPQAAIQSTENIVNAVGGFRQILKDGELSERTLALDARHPRSAAGISADGRYLYLLVIDGRRPGSVGSTESETALLLRALGAHEGINFDGGGSSALVLRYPDGKVRAVNTPIHNMVPGLERAVAGCLGVGVNNETGGGNEENR
jgi:hypothetical protein